MHTNILLERLVIEIPKTTSWGVAKETLIFFLATTRVRSVIQGLDGCDTIVASERRATVEAKG